MGTKDRDARRRSNTVLTEVREGPLLVTISATVVFLLYGGTWLSDLTRPLKFASLFLVLFSIIHSARRIFDRSTRGESRDQAGGAARHPRVDFVCHRNRSLDYRGIHVHWKGLSDTGTRFDVRRRDDRPERDGGAVAATRRVAVS